jgi:tetratricopeptide (TPR) repeat protein
LRPEFDARFESRRALETIRVCETAEALAELDAVGQRHPTSGLPLAHKGELLLWLGKLDEARAALEGAAAITLRTRWAYIGLTAVDVLMGDPARAIETCRRGVAIMNHTEGPAVYVIRGEALRRLGQLDEAERDLVRACALHPSRLSAWLNLGLLRVAQGDVGRAVDVFERLKEHAPGLLGDAAREEGIRVYDDEPPVLNLEPPGLNLVEIGNLEPPGLNLVEIGRLLGRMLEMLRGNRSSTCITYVSKSGQIRLVPGANAGAPLHARDREDLASTRRVLERAIGQATDRGSRVT